MVKWENKWEMESGRVENAEWGGGSNVSCQFMKIWNMTRLRAELTFLFGSRRGETVVGATLHLCLPLSSSLSFFHAAFTIWWSIKFAWAHLFSIQYARKFFFSLPRFASPLMRAFVLEIFLAFKWLIPILHICPKPAARMSWPEKNAKKTWSWN